MVYCQKCGTQNADDAQFCVKCGAAISASQPDYGAYWRSRGHQYRHEYRERRGRGWGTLFAGAVIVLIGMIFLLGQFYDLQISWSIIWPIVAVFVGLWFIFVAVQINRRRRSPPTQA